MANEISSALSPKVRHLLCQVGVVEFSNVVSRHLYSRHQHDPELAAAEHHHQVEHLYHDGFGCSFCDDIRARQEDGTFQESCVNSSVIPGDVDGVFSHGGFVHFTRCAEILPSITDVPIEEYYVKAVAALAPTFRHSQDILQDLSCEEFLKIYGECFLWTKKPELFQECFQLLSHRDGADDLLSLLLLCAGLERALGNLYLLRGQQCPLMLKLLLAAKELEDVLGPAAVKVLQVVIGPPMSLNIRNISWHGFLSENELPRRYIFFLLLLTASLGKMLEQQGINPRHIAFRDYLPVTKTAEIVQQLGVSELAEAEIMSLEQSILKSWLVDRGNISFFKAALGHYKHHKFGSCVFLCIPLLEHALRRIFVAVNNCPDRLVTAEATTLYTTFEEILDMSLPDGRENVLVQVLGEPFMDLLHDLLIYPCGPRVRDKLGHGEADFYSVPESLARILLITLTCLAGTADRSLEIPVGNLCHSEILQTPAGDLCHKAPASEFSHCLNNYSSVFHPVTLLRQKILHLCNHATHLHNDLKTSPDLDTWNVTDGYEMFVRFNDTFIRIQEEFKNMLDNVAESVSTVSITEWQCIKPRLLKPFCCVYENVSSVLPAKMKTLYRWQKESNTGSMKDTKDTTVGESEIVGILSRIISETETTLTQTRAALKLRQEQLVNKQLRSRQRNNMKTLLAFLPCASLLASYVAVLSAWQFCHLDSYQYLDSAVLRTIQRFLKSSLRTCEHLRTLTSSENNKWSQAGQVLVSEVKSAVQFSGQSFFLSMSDTGSVKPGHGRASNLS